MKNPSKLEGILRLWRRRSAWWSAITSSFFLFGCVAGHLSPPPTAARQTQPRRLGVVFVKVGILDTRTCVDEVMSGDGRMLMTADRPPTNPKTYLVRVWDLATLQPVTRLLPCASPYFGLSFDGRTAFTTSPNEIQVWDVATSKLSWTKKIGSEIRNVRMDRDGKHILTTSKGDNTLEVWCVGEAAPCLSIKHKDEPIFADFDPTGKRIVSCDINLHIYSAESGRELVPDFGIGSVLVDLDHLGEDFDSSGRRFLILTTWGAKVIDTATGKTLLEISSHDGVERARWSADSDKIVLIMTGGRAAVYDASTGELQQTIAAARIDDCHVLPGGRWALVDREDKPLEIWDVVSGLKVQTLDDYCCVVPPVSPNISSNLVTASRQSEIAVWRPRNDSR